MLRETWDWCASSCARMGVGVVVGSLLLACGGTDRNKHHEATTDAGTGSGGGGAGGGGATSVGGTGGAAVGGTTAQATGVGGSTGGSAGEVGETGGATGGGSGGGGSGGGGSGGGGSGGGGSGGGGGAPGDVLSAPLAGGEVEKVDLLFVIDNSISMADKQAILKLAVPALVERLVNPDCVQVDEDGNVLNRVAAGSQPGTTPDMPCADDWDVEFKPLNNIHIGVITSSLGGHGGEVCSPNGNGVASWNETKNDKGHLLPTVRTDLNLPADDPAGFLAWTGMGTSQELKDEFALHVEAAGEIGCGYEATLEAWYRFLIDPAPPEEMVVVDNVASPAMDTSGNIIVDQVVLDQRTAFLRPDSLVAIIMLTDENDCSVVDGGIGWLTAITSKLPMQTVECAANPNDPCCRSCGLAPAAGCNTNEQDANCQLPDRDSATDAPNLRCYNQKQRFGFDLLYPVERYIDALSEPWLVDSANCSGDDCGRVANPLFVRGNQIRSPSRVLLTGIVGVPWQDLATPESLTGSQLVYMTPEELALNGRWQVMLGDPARRVAPTDPLMIETLDPRSGTHPITGEALAPESSTDPTENSINGHEYFNTDNNDLQYACIFPLETPRDCSADTDSCDCAEADLPKNRPVCNPPEGGVAGLTQYFGKAYPAPRLLQVIQGLGSRATAASICPRVTSGSPADPGFGYNPAVDALIRRVQAGLGASCVNELAADVASTLACRVLEVGAAGCDCDQPGRRAIPAGIQSAVTQELAALCAERGDDCSDYCACEIEPLTGDAMDECMTEVSPALGDGWCYISPSQGVGSEELVDHCPTGQKRSVRVIGAAAELSGTELRLFCD